MSTTDPAAPESDVPLFNVYARVPTGTELDEIERRALNISDIPPERIEQLINALRGTPKLQIGSNVPLERAHKARDQLAPTGLTIEITPVLSLQSMSAREESSGPYRCPACSKEVVLPENRQCPSCGVFVDKVSDKDLLKRKIMEQERQRLELQRSRDVKESEEREMRDLEARLREEVRAELEAELGLSSGKGGLFSGKKGLVRGAALAGMLALSVGAGMGLQKSGLFNGGGTETSKSGDKSSKEQSASVDKMLDTIGPKDSAGGGTGAAAGAGSGPAGAGGAELAAVDDVFNDPLMQAANGKSGSLSLEQAVGASMTLAKGVGNTTAERALAGGPAGGKGGASNAPSAGGPLSAAAAAAASSVASGGKASAEVKPAEVSPQTKLLLTIDFARGLAEMGQSRRAQEVLKKIKSSPQLAGAPVASAALRSAELEVQAWGMLALSEGRARKAAEGLLSGSAELSDLAERASALSRIGVIVSRHTQLPPAASRAFLTQAAESLKSINDAGARLNAMSVWASSLGEVIAAEATQYAKAGQWPKVHAIATQLDELIKGAPDAASQAKLYVSQYRIRQLLGQMDKANQSLQTAAGIATKIPDIVQSAAVLRQVAWQSGAIAAEVLQPSVEAVKTQAAARNGTTRAYALMHIVLIHADAGAKTQADAVAQMVQGTPGLKPADEVNITTELLAQSDLASARSLHLAGQYAEAENVLLRLAGYLL